MTIEKKLEEVQPYSIDLCHEFGIYQRTDKYTQVKYCEVSKRLPNCLYLANVRLQILNDDNKYQLMRLCNCNKIYEEL